MNFVLVDFTVNTAASLFLILFSGEVFTDDFDEILCGSVSVFFGVRASFVEVWHVDLILVDSAASLEWRGNWVNLGGIVHRIEKKVKIQSQITEKLIFLNADFSSFPLSKHAVTSSSITRLKGAFRFLGFELALISLFSTRSFLGVRWLVINASLFSSFRIFLGIFWLSESSSLELDCFELLTIAEIYKSK